MPNDASQFENFVSVFRETPEKEKLTGLLSSIASEENNRLQHIQNSARWMKKRFGIRPSQVTWPWKNAANLHMPLTDKTIRRAKPNYANLFGSNYPTVILESNVLGDDQNLVRGIERVFHAMLFDEDQMDIFLPACWGVDLMLERGRAITKVVQQFTPQEQTLEIIIENMPQPMREFVLSPETTDEMLALEISMRYNMTLDSPSDIAEIKNAIRQLRAGQPIVELKRVVNLTPFPTLIVRDPNTVLFPQDTPFQISRARWIRDRVSLTDNDIKQRVEDGIWDKENGEKLLDRLIDKKRQESSMGNVPLQTQIEQQELQREGISPIKQAGVHTIDEVYFWKLMPGKKLAERMVLNIHPDHPDLPLRLIRYPYIKPNGDPEDWPFDQLMFEIVSDRAYAPRGYPQLLDSLQTEITNNHNAKMNSMTLSNSLNLKAKRNSGVSTQWQPGQPLWVNRMDDAMEMNLAPKDMSYDNEETRLKQWAEEYIGILDSSLTNISGGPERRTGKEIDAISALQANVASLDTRIFQACMQRVYRRIWNRWMQYGPEEISYMSPLGQPVPVSKQELKNRFKIRTIGNIFSTNRQLRANRMGSLYQELAGEPLVDRYKLLMNWLSLEDERMAMDLIKTPEQANQEQVERFIADIDRINKGYTVIPRPSDDNKTAMAVIQDYLNDPVKRRNFSDDRLETLRNFYAAHELALQKKGQATTRGGRAQEEVAKTAQGATGREARE